jgi:ATP-binding cassette, subfamily C, bacterial LapB
VVITHRASIIDLVDRVIVIDQGKIAAQGPKSDFVKPQAAANQAPPPPPPSPPPPSPASPSQEAAPSEVNPQETASGFSGVTVMKSGTRRKKAS